MCRLSHILRAAVLALAVVPASLGTATVRQTATYAGRASTPSSAATTVVVRR